MRHWILLVVFLMLVGCGSIAPDDGGNDGGNQGDGGIFDDPVVDAICSQDIPIVDLDSSFTNPELIPASKVEPVYPDAARAAAVEGTVILDAIIDTAGTTCVNKVVSQTAPGWGFDAAAVEAVEQWRYDPATMSGQPVAIGFTVFVEFKWHAAAGAPARLAKALEEIVIVVGDPTP